MIQSLLAQGREHYIPLGAYLILLLLWINPMVCCKWEGVSHWSKPTSARAIRT